MHPVNNRNFGATGIQVTYNNGTNTVVGWIVRQTGTRKFVVTSDGVNVFTVLLASTTAYASTLTPGHMTIPVTTPNGTEYVRDFYDLTLVTTASNRYKWNMGASVNGSIAIPSAPAPVTNLVVTSPSAGHALVTFTPPANTTGVSYLVQYTDLTASGTVQTVSPSPSASPVSIASLTSTHNYSFSVAAMNTSATSPAVTTTRTIT